MRRYIPLVPDHTAPPDSKFLHMVQEVIVGTLTKDSRLDVVRVKPSSIRKAEGSGMALARISVRSHAIDPNILSEHLTRAIREDPKAATCVLVISGISLNPTDATMWRRPWEAAAVGWWVPVASVARRRAARPLSKYWN